MPAATSALRIRLEGRLEIIEAGIARYRKARSLERGALEELLAREDELGAAAGKAARLPEADPILRALFAARRALRRRVRKRLQKLGVDPFRLTLAEELEALLARLLPPARSPQAARFEVKAQWNVGAVMGGTTVAMAIFVLSPWFGVLAGLAIGALLLSERGKLDVYADRIRLERLFREPVELPLQLAHVRAVGSFAVTPLGHLSMGTEYTAQQLATVVELLRFPAFKRIGELSDEDVWHVEAREGDDEGAALVSPETAVFIPDGDQAYNLAAEQQYDWTAPRAWLLAHLISRLPADDRRAVVTRLTVSGCARVLARDELLREFEHRW